ncbi:MAG: putative stage sporulation protein YqfD [Firmicutes bacterium]|nr:putative stage sporulation protein YqfD [Bacillota bacterium]
MTRKISSYIKGAVKIKIQGENQERFINLCISKQMQLWGVRKLEDSLFIWLSLHDFFRIRDAVRKAKVKVFVVESYGFPFFLKRLKRRKILLYGAIVFFIAIYVLSGYIWFIDIVGVKNIPKEKINMMIESSGLCVGVRQEKVDTKKLEKEILLSVPEVAWVGIHFTGTRAVVEIVEKVIAPSEDKSPGDFIAGKSGTITECITILGESKVKIGDKVQAGDILLKGIGKNNEAVRAKGIVKAHVQYESFGESLLEEQVYSLTGNRKFGVKINFCGQIIDLNQVNLADFIAYEHEVIVKSIPSWRNSDFVVEFIIDVYRELEVDTIAIDEIEAKKIATREALAENKVQIPLDAYVVAQDFKVIDTDDPNLIRVKLTIETEELIGMYNQYNKE